MATITEDYCSYEVAKMLKEKGFNEPCLYYYFSDGKIGKTKGLKDRNCPSVNTFSMPTHQMAMAWLREVHNLFICVEFDAPTFVADIYKMDEIDEHGCAKHIQPTIANCKTYEEAVEAALKYVLENLI